MQEIMLYTEVITLADDKVFFVSCKMKGKMTAFYETGM